MQLPVAEASGRELLTGRREARWGFPQTAITAGASSVDRTVFALCAGVACALRQRPERLLLRRAESYGELLLLTGCR